MKKMYIEDAVNYCLSHKAVIHTPNEDIYNSLMSYLDESSLKWFNVLKASKFNCYSDYKKDTCIRIIKQDYNIYYSCVNYFKDRGYEIIELESPDEITITIKSDGHKVVSASCNDITVEAKCNDTDTFNLSKGSHIALKRLIDKMNEPAKLGSIFKTGDIVEVIGNSINAHDESIGLQGIITDITRDYFTVTFPVKICDFCDWNYLSKDLKLIRKASK